MWYETIRFKDDFSCEGCRNKIARRASDWAVTDSQGHLRNASSIVEEYDPRADYEIICPTCGLATEFRSPEQVKQYKTIEVPKRYVVRLT